MGGLKALLASHCLSAEERVATICEALDNGASLQDLYGSDTYVPHTLMNDVQAEVRA